MLDDNAYLAERRLVQYLIDSKQINKSRSYDEIYKQVSDIPVTINELSDIIFELSDYDYIASDSLGHWSITQKGIDYFTLFSEENTIYWDANRIEEHELTVLQILGNKRMTHAEIQRAAAKLNGSSETYSEDIEEAVDCLIDHGILNCKDGRYWIHPYGHKVIAYLEQTYVTLGDD